MGRPYNIYYFESIKNLSDTELNVYIFFIDMYLYYGCKPLNLSVEQIYTAIKLTKNTVQKALNGLYKKGFYKVFKDDLYNKNCYVPIFIWDEMYKEIQPIPIPDNIYNDNNVDVKGTTKNVKFGIYKNQDHKIEILNVEQYGQI